MIFDTQTVNLNRVLSGTRVENGRSLEDLGNAGDLGEFAECGSYQLGIFNSFDVTGIFTGLKEKALAFVSRCLANRSLHVLKTIGYPDCSICPKDRTDEKSLEA